MVKLSRSCFSSNFAPMTGDGAAPTLAGASVDAAQVPEKSGRFWAAARTTVNVSVITVKTTSFDTAEMLQRQPGRRLNKCDIG